MDRTLTHRIAALLVGVAVSGGLVWLTGAPALAGAAGLCWGVGVGVALRTRRQHPGMPNDDGWTDARWTGLGVGIVTLAGLLGVSPAPSLSPGLRFGFSVLVLGAGVVAYATATMAEIERHPDGPAHEADLTGEEAASARTRGTDRSPSSERR